MRFRFTLIFILLACYNLAFGQTFFPVGGPVHTQEMAPEQANEAYIHFDNPSGDTLRLRWRRLEVKHPEEWDIDLCDYGTCYIGIPSNSEMSFVYDSIQPYLKLIVQPGQTPGSAWLWFRVYELDNEDNFQDVYFSLHTPGVVSANPEPGIAAMSVFPNPANESLNLRSESSEAVPVRILNSTGRVVWEGLHKGSTQINTSAWPSGLVFLQYDNVSQTLIITHP